LEKDLSIGKLRMIGALNRRNNGAFKPDENNPVYTLHDSDAVVFVYISIKTNKI
jgi:hypothetical protein